MLDVNGWVLEPMFFSLYFVTFWCLLHDFSCASIILTYECDNKRNKCNVFGESLVPRYHLLSSVEGRHVDSYS